MSTGIIKLLGSNGRELFIRRYGSVAHRKTIVKIWAERHGKLFKEMELRVIPDFEDSDFDDKGIKISRKTKSIDFIKENYSGNAIEIAMELGVTRQTIYNLLNEINETDNRVLSKDEIEFIKENKNKLIPKKIAEKLNIPLHQVYYHLKKETKIIPSDHPIVRERPNYSNRNNISQYYE
jgi:hypothetical protein